MATILTVVGIAVEVAAVLCVPLVLVRRREPPSTVAWLLALVFLPVIGVSLFLLFGRDRLRIPLFRKKASDLRLRSLRDPSQGERLLKAAREGALTTLSDPLDREIFRVGVAFGGAEPVPGNAVEILVDGVATYAALGRAIESAERVVYAEYYLLRPDGTTKWFLGVLAAAARRGVAVKLLIDGYGSFWIRRRHLAELRAAGAEVAYFLPARLLFFQPMNLRNHRKIVVVDDTVAFTGGINVGDEYRGIGGPWRDTHMRVTGPAAHRLADVFIEDWHFATRREISEKEHRARTEEDDRVASERGGGAMVAIVKSGPDESGLHREAIHRLFFTAITSARSRLFITTPYFVPDRSIVVALQTAAARGIDVRLLFPSVSNHAVVFQAGRSFYEDLLQAGVRIYEYGPGMIHAKTMVVDGRIGFVGSANMDLRSFRLNFEIHAIIRDELTAERLEQVFLDDLAVSKCIDRELFHTRPARQRLAEGVARLLSPLM